MGFIASFLGLSRAKVAVHNLDLAQPPSAHLSQLLTFHSDLAQRLHHLTLAGVSAHPSWLLDALSATISTHSSLHSALTTSSSFPASHIHSHPLHDSSHLSLQIDHPQQQRRSDEVVNFLDVCNALKQVVASVDRQLVRLQEALQNLEEALHPSATAALSSSCSSAAHHSTLISSCRVRKGARRLAACLQNHSMVSYTDAELNKALEGARASLLLARRGLKRAPRPRKAEPEAALLSQGMHGAALTTLSVLAAAVSSLAPNCKKSIRIISRVCKLSAGALEKASPWAAPLAQLQQDVIMKAEKGKEGALFQELQILYTAAATLLSGMNKSVEAGSAGDNQMVFLRAGMKRLRERAQEMQECVQQVGIDIGQLFQALIDLRVATLDALPAAPAALRRRRI